jgi:hypothetical protein
VSGQGEELILRAITEHSSTQGCGSGSVSGLDPDSIGSVDPESGSVDPESGSVDPESGSVDPESGSVDPESGSGSGIRIRIQEGKNTHKS